MTGRGWWCLFAVVLMLLAGVLAEVTALTVTGLALLLWFGWEWVFFALRVRTLLGRLRVHREVWDERGPIGTLWAGRTFTVRVELRLDGKGQLPYAAVADPVPFGVRHQDGDTTADGAVSGESPLQLEYRVHCPLPGLARFEGLRLEVTDLQGFFVHIGFLREPVVLRILPGILVHKAGSGSPKEHNTLPPPGVHRMRHPGSGSELLDLRDYVPGDPPRTIAWKISARRDKLITKEFESEVPVRCTLFVDTSSSVRVPSPPLPRPGRSQRDERKEALYFKPLDRLVDLAAGVIHACSAVRDLVGLCLFDERSSRVVRPERNTTHRNRLMQMLGEAAALGPVAHRADADALLPVASALAQEVYPDLLRDEVNRMPAWLAWFVATPLYTRHPRGRLARLHRRKGTFLLWGTTLIPLALAVVNLVVLFTDWAPDWARTLLGAVLFLGVPLAVGGAWLLFLVALLGGGGERRKARWRKRLAALFALRQGLHDGGIEALLQDDDLFSLHLQHFLAEHQVPVSPPLYDEQGNYLFAHPEKVTVLAQALLASTARGRDNELYVLLADLLELDGQLDPLLQAVRVALGRHHQVVAIVPWPSGVPLPSDDQPRRSRHGGTLGALVHDVTVKHLHAAYARLRRTFARLGVPVLCAATEESVPLVLRRLEALRGARQMAGAAGQRRKE